MKENITNPSAEQAVQAQHKAISHAIHAALHDEDPNTSAYWDYVHMCRLFEMMDTSDIRHPEPFCFEHASDEVAERLGIPSYYGIESGDKMFNLDTPEGRKAWKAAAPDGQRVIPEDGVLWANIFFSSHIKPRLLKFLSDKYII